MVDEKSYHGQNNIRGLVQDLAERFDAASNALRAETAFANVSRADAKTFMLISRHPRGLTDLANALGVSRQAAHKSIKRLIAEGLVAFEYAEGSKRDMIASITEKGIDARKTGLKIASQIEAQARDAIGADDLETLRRLLLTLLGAQNDLP